MKLAILWMWVAAECSLGSARTSRQEQNCECIPVYQCNFSTDGTGIIDIRVDKSGCPNLLDVCCPVESSPPLTVPPPQPVTVLPPPLQTKPTCGQQWLQSIEDRVTGNMEALYGEYPWMAAVLGPGNKYICGGSLIHPAVVLTAAHCVAGVDTEVRVRLGEWDSQHKNEPQPVQNRIVRDIVIHEQYKPGPLFNDIALLFLDNPVEIGGNIGTVCLPEFNENMDGRQCYATGWGKDEFGKAGKHPAVLHSVELGVVNRDECQHKLRSTKLGQFFKLHLSFLCAGGEEGKDTCKGDGGGPLVCPTKQNPDVYEQAGIVSWGIECGTRTPAAYTNVALFRSWVDLQLLRRRLVD